MSEAEDEHERMEELVRAASETQKIAPTIIEDGRNRTEAGQQALDLANSIIGLTKEAPDGFFIPGFQHVAKGLREFNSTASSMAEQIPASKKLLRISQIAATSTSVTSSFAIASAWDGAETNRATRTIPATRTIQALQTLNMLLHRSVDVTAVVASMEELGLDVARGDKRSPVTLLRSAEEALKRPPSDSGYQTGVLIPVRVSIEETINELLKKRRTMEPAKSWIDKVTSIARYCGHTTLSPNHVTLVADTTHRLIDLLSHAKDRNMQRDSILLLFDQGVSLLRDVCALVDHTRLRA